MFCNASLCLDSFIVDLFLLQAKHDTADVQNDLKKEQETVKRLRSERNDLREENVKSREESNAYVDKTKQLKSTIQKQHAMINEQTDEISTLKERVQQYAHRRNREVSSAVHEALQKQQKEISI